MEEKTSLNVVLKEKMDRYNSNLADFVAPSELTVTITLSEYRELVGKAAVLNASIEKEKSARYEAEKTANTLREENARLKAELYEATKEKAADEKGDK